MLWLPKYLYHAILQRDYRKMTIKWSFSYYSFVKLPPFKKHDSLITRSIHMDPKYSVIKGLYCILPYLYVISPFFSEVRKIFDCKTHIFRDKFRPREISKTFCMFYKISLYLAMSKLSYDGKNDKSITDASGKS